MSILYKNKTVNQGNLSVYSDQQPAKSPVSFNSKIERFGYKIQRSPGPGTYNQHTSNFSLNTYHIPKQSSKKQGPIRKELQWIWGSDRTSYMQSKNVNYLGPGAYNPTDAQLAVGSHNTNWGKSERFVYNSKKGSNSKGGDIPGPGSYSNESELMNTKKNTMGSVFRSKSPKTYLEKMISQASVNEEKIKRSIEVEMFENPEKNGSRMNEEDDKLNKSLSSSVKKKGHASQTSVFASKMPRISEQTFGNEVMANNNVGPGSYDLAELSKSRSKDKLPKIVTVKSDDRANKRPKKKAVLPPGPGSYEIDETQNNLHKKSCLPIDRSERFQEKSEQLPGPGSYMQKKHVFMSELEKKMKKVGMGAFNSSSEREGPEIGSSKDNPFGSYNLQYFDMQYRMKKKQEHIDKLRIMEVSLPAFNTKQKK